jgi:preprotein translocase subunit SecG
MLYAIISGIFVLDCLLLLLVILMQQGRGGDIASAFGGGGSQTAFGARQGATVLSKATAVLGAIFLIGALALGILRQTTVGGSVISGIKAPARPAAPANPTATPTPAPATPGQSTPAATPPASGQSNQAPAAPANPPVENPKPSTPPQSKP